MIHPIRELSGQTLRFAMIMISLTSTSPLSYAQDVPTAKIPPVSVIETRKVHKPPRLTAAQRITALETKTNYYQKSNKTITANYGTAAPVISSSEKSGVSLSQNSATCDGIDIEQDPQISGYGTLYAWLSIEIAYSGITPSPDSEEYSIVWGRKVEPMDIYNSCFDTFQLNQSSGKTTLKAFCGIDMSPGSIIRFHFVGATSCTTESVNSFKLTMKSNLLEMVEPAN